MLWVLNCKLGTCQKRRFFFLFLVPHDATICVSYLIFALNCISAVFTPAHIALSPAAGHVSSGRYRLFETALCALRRLRAPGTAADSATYYGDCFD
ncbi:hypothetical protein DENSPDRAFT_1047 [Dentipellis sp. KUC8613]|nr:hypothetical protein DENSPDRAFT_1047 [Dentipellis sp. KUC8613]